MSKLLTVLAVLLSGCAGLRPTEVDNRKFLRGKTQQEILACMGTAERMQTEGTLTVWKYKKRHCNVEFGFVDSVVKRISYSQADPGRCDIAIKECLPAERRESSLWDQ